jgi:hypothetical protein
VVRESQAIQALDAIVCGYGRNRDAARLVMFKAYFDDSSSDEDDKNFVLAGCIQSYKVWADFTFLWEAALAARPSIKYFHMREARKLEGQFERWKATERDRKIKHLATVLASFRPWTLSAYISKKEHEAILKPVSPHLIRHPYFSLFYTVVLKLAHWHHDMGITAPVNYVFDEQGVLGEDAVIWYQHIKSWQKPELAELMGGTPGFENDKVVLPLQAADMLAWHVRRWKDNPEDDRSQWATAPLDGLTYNEVRLTKDALITAAEKMKQIPHLDFVQHKSKSLSRTTLHQIVRAIPPERTPKK